MPKPRQVAVAVPIVLPWLLSSHEITALDIPQELASTASQLEAKSPLFLLCSSRKHPKRFLFSKGGIEKGEDAEFAAIREGWEEAGFRGIALQSLGAPIEDTRPHKHASPSDTEPRATYHFFLVLITSLSKDWPERHERHRKWCTATEVRELTRWKEEVGKAFVNMPTDLDSLEKLVKSKTSSS